MVVCIFSLFGYCAKVDLATEDSSDKLINNNHILTSCNAEEKSVIKLGKNYTNQDKLNSEFDALYDSKEIFSGNIVSYDYIDKYKILCLNVKRYYCIKLSNGKVICKSPYYFDLQDTIKKKYKINLKDELKYDLTDFKYYALFKYDITGYAFDKYRKYLSIESPYYVLLDLNKDKIIIKENDFASFSKYVNRNYGAKVNFIEY